MTAPVAFNVKVSPGLPRDNATLSVTWMFYDADGHTENANEIRWYRDNVLDPTYNDDPSITPPDLEVGEAWMAEVRVQDSNLEWSPWTSSPTVYIGDDWDLVVSVDRGRETHTENVGGSSETTRTANRFAMPQSMIGRMVSVDFSFTSHSRLHGFDIEYLVRRGMKK